MNKILALLAVVVILAGCTAQQQSYNQDTGSQTGAETGSNTGTLESIGSVSTESLNNLTNDLQGMSFDEFGGVEQ